ncbi:MAG TPA: hypothetical protein VM487_13885 [Phycisphaerae bacterium]|nr:hypothetical protein [Phycisphaerae bacterium]
MTRATSTRDTMAPACWAPVETWEPESEWATTGSMKYHGPCRLAAGHGGDCDADTENGDPPEQPYPNPSGVRQWARGVLEDRHGKPITPCGGCGGELVRRFGLCQECEFRYERCRAEHIAYLRAATNASAWDKADQAARFQALADERFPEVVRLGEAYRPVDADE